MPWKETCPTNERMQLIARLRQGERMTDLCAEFGISRKTGYKLKARFEEYGPEALYDQTRSPKRIPHRTSRVVRELLVQTRKAHPTWGPKKLKAWLLGKHEGIRLPAVSTIGEILKAEGTPFTPEEVFAAIEEAHAQSGLPATATPIPENS